MVSSQFGSILKEFEPLFNCPLEVDENNSCLITLENGVSVQIELDRAGMILIGARLGRLQMGGYRNNLIEQALKHNEVSPLTCGILGYSQKSNQLILFMKLNPLTLNRSQIQNLIPPFVKKAKLWKDAIEKGTLPDLTPPPASSKEPSGLFGLIS